MGKSVKKEKEKTKTKKNLKNTYVCTQWPSPGMPSEVFWYDPQGLGTLPLCAGDPQASSPVSHCTGLPGTGPGHRQWRMRDFQQACVSSSS